MNFDFLSTPQELAAVAREEDMPRGERIAAHASMCSMWSASLPAIFGYPARPWNGRELSDRERHGALLAYVDGGPAAALEWLSEHAL